MSFGDGVLKKLSIGDKVEYRYLSSSYRGTVCRIRPANIGSPHVYIKTSSYSEKPLGAATINQSEYFKVNGRDIK
tara:strand:- start:653 stop:877 length:225 start_codon:yes stop_codon:yes gene_type:complete